ncbi:hypothetical protein JCM10908_002470 [Rhodotorula pacifica]|uniref:uncharacterized protein n=1 Tax=Rhodotorula pacifica TaxID=1495444 RepID=UPI00317334E2
MFATPHRFGSSPMTGRANLASLPTELKIKIALALAEGAKGGLARHRAFSSLTLVNHAWQEVCEPIAHEDSVIDTSTTDGDGAILLPPQRLRRFLRSVHFELRSRGPLAPLVKGLLAPSERIETLGVMLDDDYRDLADLVNTLDQLRPFVRSVHKLDLLFYRWHTPNELRAATRLLQACSDLRDLYLDISPPEKRASSDSLEAYEIFNRTVFALSTLRKVEIWRTTLDIGSSLQLDWPQLRQIKIIWNAFWDTSSSDAGRALHLFLLSLPRSLVSICVDWSYDCRIRPHFAAEDHIASPSKITFPRLAYFIQRGLDGDALCLIDSATPIRCIEYGDFSNKDFLATGKFRLAQPIKTVAEVAYETSRLSPEEEMAFRAWADRYGIKITCNTPDDGDEGMSI